MENQAKTNTEQKEQQLKKLSKMSLIRSLLPVVGLVVIFLLFNVLTNFRMVGNLSLVLSQVYVTMIAATGVFFIMTMGGLDFSQGSILGIASIVVCMLSKISIPLAIVGGIAAGAAIGALNGYFYVYRKIKSFIVTICTMFLFRGFIKYLTTNAPVAGSAKLINYDSTALKMTLTIIVVVFKGYRSRRKSGNVFGYPHRPHEVFDLRSGRSDHRICGIYQRHQSRIGNIFRR